MALGGTVMNNNNLLSTQIENYIAYKQSLGYLLTGDAFILRSFGRYTCECSYEGSLTLDIVLKWIDSTGKKTEKSKGRKFLVIKPFSKFAVSIDPQATLLPDNLFPNCHLRPAPYLYTCEDLKVLKQQCDALYSPDGIRRETVKTLIGLLWATGMRPSEPFKLLVGDVDFESRTLFIRETKFKKDRIIPISSTTALALLSYLQYIENKVGHRTSDDMFFYNTHGCPMKSRDLTYAFQVIRREMTKIDEKYSNIRLYDFRHTLASDTIRKWLDEDFDVNSRLYTLSVYLGHDHVEDTYWYLSSTPDLMRKASNNYEKYLEEDDYE